MNYFDKFNDLDIKPVHTYLRRTLYTVLYLFQKNDIKINDNQTYLFYF